MKFLYRPSQPHLVFKWRFYQFENAADAIGPGLKTRNAMLHISKFSNLSAINRHLRDITVADAMLFNEVISLVNQTESRFKQLIESRAWTDAALALIDLELPFWQIRRLVYDDGEWHCALSRERELPDWLDQSIEARHADLALAILSAFVEARRVSAPESWTRVPEAEYTAGDLYETLPIDNYV
jgi:hypothetical protein